MGDSNEETLSYWLEEAGLRLVKETHKGIEEWLLYRKDGTDPIIIWQSESDAISYAIGYTAGRRFERVIAGREIKALKGAVDAALNTIMKNAN